MDSLSRIFGSPIRLKLLRLFLFNDDTAFTLAEAAFRAKAPKGTARKELTALLDAGVLKKRAAKGGTLYQADRRYEHYESLMVFLRSTTTIRDKDLLKMFKKGGAIRAIILSGIFTGSIEPKVDLLIVADKFEERQLKLVIRSIEAELGRELRYASFLTPDFRYRAGVYDRLIRDVMDYPHRTILDKIGI